MPTKHDLDTSLGVSFKESDEHLCHFYMGVPPRPTGLRCQL